MVKHGKCTYYTIRAVIQCVNTVNSFKHQVKYEGTHKINTAQFFITTLHYSVKRYGTCDFILWNVIYKHKAYILLLISSRWYQMYDKIQSNRFLSYKTEYAFAKKYVNIVGLSVSVLNHIKTHIYIKVIISGQLQEVFMDGERGVSIKWNLMRGPNHTL